MTNRLGWGLGLLVAMTGCGEPAVEPVDSGPRDASTTDANRDAGPPVDTGVIPEDTGVLPEDTGVPVDAFVGVDAAVVTTGCELTGYPALDTQELRAGAGLDLVTALEIAPGRDDIFVAQRGGRIVRMDPTTGAIAATAFLDMSSALGGTPDGGNEWGLLGLAFHPDFATNGLFYVDYTPGSGPAENRVAVGHVTGGADTADPGVTTILAVADFASNHNGGQLVFGPDGYLYVGMGDGGLGGDPRDNGQDTGELLGKILRLDVTATGYTSPATNPFSGASGREEIWAYGFRNPWRFSFDSLTGDLYIADVGQNAWEEIDVAPAGTGAGDNFGWSVCEGTHNHGGGDCAGLAGHHGPIFEYSHTGMYAMSGYGSIAGGYVYRGSAIPGLNGAYLFADTTSGVVGALRYCDGASRDPMVLGDLTGLCNPTTFGLDRNGEMLMGCASGTIFRVIPG